MDRRRFLASASVLSVGALVTAACGDGVIAGPEVIPEFPRTPFDFDPRSVAALQQVGGRVVISSGLASPILLERLSTSRYRALSLVCPHRGTIVDVTSSGFVCPNHGARYALDGAWTGGQATGSLAPVAVRMTPEGTLSIGGVPTPPVLALGAPSVVFVTTTSGGSLAPQTVAIDNDGDGVLTGLQVSLTYEANQRSGWLSVALDQPSGPATLTLTAQRGTIPAGTYTATVVVTAAGSANGPQSVAVTMLVQDPSSPASLLLSTAAVAFVAPQGVSPAPLTVQCNNGGGGALLGLAVAITYRAGGPGGAGWLSVALSQKTAPATLSLQANPVGLAVGSYSATVTVSATGVPSRTLDVTLTVNPPGLQVILAAWPALANIGGAAGSVGNVNGGPVAVVRTGLSGFAAFSMRCPHQGGTVQVINGSSFRCPNHGALFDNAGNNLPNSPQQTDNLTPLTVIYEPGAPTLVVS